MISNLKNKKTLLIIAIIALLGFISIYYTLFNSKYASGMFSDKIITGNFSEDESKSLNTLKKIDDFPVYTMNFYGDYGFSDYLKEGKKISEELKSFYIADSVKDYNACSCVAALSDGEDKIFGRNLDYYYSPKLLLFTSPSDGYASVSMVDLRHVGFLTEEQLEEASSKDLEALLYTPYLPFDGMNEYGLAVGEMTALGTKTSIDLNKVTLGDLTVIRLVLDRARTVDEAVDLMKNYNVYFPPAPPLHFMISDRGGKSAVIEFIEGEMKIISNEEPWQVSTNFLIYGSNDDTKNGCRRYAKAQKIINEKEGKLSEKEMMLLLKDISQRSTQWSIVYNMDKGNINLSINRKYGDEDIKHFKLKMK